MTRAEWDAEQAKRGRNLIAKGWRHAEALRVAWQITEHIYGPRPAADPKPAQGAGVSLWQVLTSVAGLALWRRKRMEEAKTFDYRKMAWKAAKYAGVVCVGAAAEVVSGLAADAGFLGIFKDVPQFGVILTAVVAGGLKALANYLKNRTPKPEAQ